MANLFYFWKNSFKEAKFGWFGLFKGQMATLLMIKDVASAWQLSCCAHPNPTGLNGNSELLDWDQTECQDFLCIGIRTRSLECFLVVPIRHSLSFPLSSSHTHTHTHTYIHTHTLTHTYTHIHTQAKRLVESKRKKKNNRQFALPNNLTGLLSL